MPLPLVLAGPILRRVDANVCSVWIALSQAAQVEFRVWANAQMAAGLGSVASGTLSLASAHAPTRRFGASLHVAVVTIDLRPSAEVAAVPLVPGGYHAYNVIIDGAHDLKTLGLLRDETAGQRLPNVDTAAPLHKALGYTTDRLPGFVVPAPTLDRLRLAHASCRRPHHPSYDAMAYLDDWLAANLNDPAKWPQQLFLTGDQIYADDVAPPLLTMLNALGQELLGNAPEQFPIDGQQRFPLTAANFQPQRRGKLVRQFAQLSTKECHNHLLGFGEFAAMYLAAWSPRAWRALPTDAQIDTELFRPRTDAAPALRDALSDWEQAFEGNFDKWKQDPDLGTAHAKTLRDEVALWRDAVPKAARALANISTYMIWDDHEVTDDWNLAGQWRTRVMGREPGRAIVRHGMMAYGIFQGWGNDPLEYMRAGGPNRRFLDEAEAVMAGPGPHPATPTAALDAVLGVTDGPAANRVKWHYTVDGRIHRAVVLDTRMQRDLDSPVSVRPPRLVGDTLNAQLPDGPLANGLQLLVVVSAAPVLGPTLFDNVMQPLGAAVKDLVGHVKEALRDVGITSPYSPVEDMKHGLEKVPGREDLDIESWTANENDHEALLRKLAGYGRAVVLSGDVHFSCTMTLDYFRTAAAPAAPPPPARIVQLTCSGAHNGWPLAAEGNIRKNTILQDLLSGGMDSTGVVAERMAWTGPAQMTLPLQPVVGPGRRARMGRSPALLPVIGWPAGTTIDAPPNWGWRLRLVRDLRTGGANGAPADPPTLAADIDPAAPFSGYKAVVTRHALVTMQMPRLLRTLHFLSNVGLVHFEPDGAGPPTLVHQLLSASAPQSQTFALNTVHRAVLATPSDDVMPMPATL